MCTGLLGPSGGFPSCPVKMHSIPNPCVMLSSRTEKQMQPNISAILILRLSKYLLTFTEVTTLWRYTNLFIIGTKRPFQENEEEEVYYYSS